MLSSLPSLFSVGQNALICDIRSLPAVAKRRRRVIRGAQRFSIFSETLPIFFLCSGVMNTNERLEMISPWRAGARECGTKVAMTRKSRKAKTRKKENTMKNRRVNSKSKITNLIAACLVLAVLGPSAAVLSRADSGRGSPPGVIDQTFTLPGICGFDVQGTVTGRQGVISLPSGGFIVTGPGQYATFTNLSDPTKSATVNLPGAFHISFDQNGDTIYMVTGRNGLTDPSLGILLLVGDFTFVYDSNGNLIEGPTGNGQITDICAMIN
jgi:hypothetical protein